MTDPRRREFRDLLDAPALVKCPFVHDALTAKVADESGFDLVGITGHGVSISSVGLPDAGYVTMPEAVTATRNIAHAVDAPVFADIDTGYGNAINARRTAGEVIRNTEVAGFYMEDQTDPKRCGHVAGKRVLSREEAVGKVRAVCDLRDELDEAFVVIARTDAAGAAGGSLDEAIARGNAFAEAGADVVFPDAPTSEAAVRRLGEEIDAPLFYNTGGVGRSVSPPVDLETLDEYGYAIAAFHCTLTPTINAVAEYMEGVMEDGIDHIAAYEEEMGDLPVGDGDFYRFEGMEAVADEEREYLPDEEQEKYDTSTGKEV